MLSACKNCGKILKREWPGGLCESCYRYFLKGGRLQTPPPPGIIGKDERGYIICHICGMAYVRLGSHVRESHAITISEYKEKFGLCESSHTTEDNYSKKMHKYAVDNCMPEQLMESGKKTRIKPGDNRLRFGKKIRLQESNIKKQRRKK